MKKSEHWLFFIVTFVWSWSLWVYPIYQGFDSPLAMGLFAIGGIAPSTVGIFLAYRKRDSEYWRDFWHRIISFRQIKTEWYLFIFLFIPLTNILALLINYLFTGSTPQLEILMLYVTDPLRIIPLALYIFVFGPLVEEIGWRGFALDHLQAKYSWFRTSVIIGICWASWHIPLFFMEGTYQYSLLNDSGIYLLDFIIAFFPISIIMDWVYHQNGRSILSGILFHFSLNFFGELINIPNYLKPYRTMVVLIFAVLILISWKKKSLITVKGVYENE